MLMEDVFSFHLPGRKQNLPTTHFWISE